MKQESALFLDKAHTALTNTDLQERMQFLGRVLADSRGQGIAQLGNFEEVRAHYRRVKDHTLENLEGYFCTCCPCWCIVWER